MFNSNMSFYLPCISFNLCRTSREHLEEEDHRKIKARHDAEVASQQAEKKKKYSGREKLNKSGRGSTILNDLHKLESDDEDEEIGEHDDEGGIKAAVENERSSEDETENGTGGEKTGVRSGRGAASLKNRLGEFLHFTHCNNIGLQRTVIYCNQEVSSLLGLDNKTWINEQVYDNEVARVKNLNKS